MNKFHKKIALWVALAMLIAMPIQSLAQEGHVDQQSNGNSPVRVEATGSSTNDSTDFDSQSGSGDSSISDASDSSGDTDSNDSGTSDNAQDNNESNSNASDSVEKEEQNGEVSDNTENEDDNNSDIDGGSDEKNDGEQPENNEDNGQVEEKTENEEEVAEDVENTLEESVMEEPCTVQYTDLYGEVIGSVYVNYDTEEEVYILIYSDAEGEEFDRQIADDLSPLTSEDIFETFGVDIEAQLEEGEAVEGWLENKTEKEFSFGDILDLNELLEAEEADQDDVKFMKDAMDNVLAASPAMAMMMVEDEDDSTSSGNMITLSPKGMGANWTKYVYVYKNDGSYGYGSYGFYSFSKLSSMKAPEINNIADNYYEDYYGTVNYFDWSKEDKAFLGWNTKDDGSGIWVSAGGDYNSSLFSSEYGYYISRLYAQWGEVDDSSYTIQYNLAGGTGSVEPTPGRIVEAIQDITGPKDVFGDNETLMGWSIHENAETADYKAGDEISASAEGWISGPENDGIVPKTLTLYAVWKSKNEHSVTFKYYDWVFMNNGDYKEDTISVIGNISVPEIPETVAKSNGTNKIGKGYKFKGYWKSGNSQYYVNDDGILCDKNKKEVNITSDMVFTAEYESLGDGYIFQDTGTEGVAVYYSLNGESLIEVPSGSSVFVPKNKAKGIMFFAGVQPGFQATIGFDGSPNQDGNISKIKDRMKAGNYNSYGGSSFVNAATEALSIGCSLEFCYSSWDTSKYSYRTFILKAEPIDYRVEYDNNGGSGKITDSNTYHINLCKCSKGKSVITITDSIPTKAGGYTFLGWKLSGGDDTNYSAGSKLTVDAKMAELAESNDRKFTFVAQWTKNAYYTVMYKVNDTNGEVLYTGNVEMNKTVDELKKGGVKISIEAPETYATGDLNYRRISPSPNEVEIKVNGQVIEFYYQKIDAGELTITKTVKGAIAPGESFIFTVKSDAKDFNEFQVTLSEADFNGGKTASVTITGLPAGEYTIIEDTDWSWKYTAKSTSKIVTIDEAGNGSDTADFTNTLDAIPWASGAAAKANDFTKA